MAAFVVALIVLAAAVLATISLTQGSAVQPQTENPDLVDSAMLPAASSTSSPTVQNIATAAPTPYLPSVYWHTVVDGDTPEKLGSRFGVTPSEIIAANEVGAFQPGQRIIIPPAASVPASP